MRLYRGKIPIIADSIVKTLISDEAIEVEPDNVTEVRMDIEATLHEYLRTEREINDEVRETMEARGEGSFGRLKRTIARRRKFGLGEEGIDWMVNQLIEVLLHTNHIEEVWAEDAHLRVLMREPLRKHMDLDEEMDQKVRERIKNLNENSSSWEVRYQQELERIKKLQGLDP